MPSTNKLSSRTTRSVAKFLLSFCGLASFGVVTMAINIAAVFSVAILGFSNAHATGSSNSNTITANLPGSVAIRLLDSTGTTEISSLDFNNLTPTPQGTTASKSFIVDVATSNPTGYKLYMQSDYKIDDGDNDSSNDIYTTNLTHTDSDVTDNIPTLVPGSGSSADTKVYWNYINPLTNSGSSNPTPSVIPPYGTPDKIAQYFSPTNSHQSTIDINVGIDTTIVSGTYENQLLFSAVGNPTPANYTIVFNADGGSPEPSTITTSAAASTYATNISDTAPAKAGYSFNYWSISVSSGTDIDPTAVCNANNNNSSSSSSNNSSTCNPGDTLSIDINGEASVTVTLTAIYTINPYTLTLDPNGGAGDWTSAGFSYDSTTGTYSKTQDYNTDVVVADPTTNASYTISYSDNSQSATCSGISGTSCTGTAAPTRAFTGWDLTATAGGTATGSFDDTTNTYTYGSEDDTLTALWNSESSSFTLPSITKTGHDCYWASDTTGTWYADGGDTKTVSSDTNLYAYCTVNQYKLTVNPNGGTWGGSTSSQVFTQDYGTTKTIGNPTATPTYSITYNANGQGATYTGSPTSVNRPFTSWAYSQGGDSQFDQASGQYTFGNGNSTLLAQYSSTSSSFTLPAISKTDYTCYWASNTTGTKYGNGGDSKTITGNLTIYAYCTANSRTIATATYLQEVTECPSTLTTGAQYSLKDQGETSKSYNTSKLADGKCWMTTNYNRSAGALTSTYYHVSSSGYTVPTSNCSSSSPQWSSDSGQYYCNNSTYGGYYSWKTAAANDTSTSYDICPKGWRLPTKAEFDTLISTYSAASAGSKLTQSPVNMVYGGFCNSESYVAGCPVVAGTGGYYWSSTTSSSTQAYYLYFSSSSASTRASVMRGGYSVRCVFGS